MTSRRQHLLFAMAVSTALAKVGSAQVVTSSDLGPSFVVPDTTPNNPQYIDQPDGRIAYLPDPLNPGEYEMYWAGGNYVSEGASVTSQSGPLNSTDLLPGTPAPSYDQHNWLMSVYPLSVSEPGAPAGDLIGFFHAEDYNFNGVTGGTWKSQGVAYSTNDGLTWTIGGQILSVPKPSVVSQGGFGDMSVVWDPANSTWYSFTGEGPYGAESTSPTGAPGTWSMYDNGGFNSPGLDGTPTALPGLQNYSGGSPDYIYSTYLGEWCRVWVDSNSGGRNVLLSTTGDLIHYDPVVTLVTNTSSVNSIAYPTVIGTSDVSMGQNAWLYSAVFLPSGARQFTAEAIHLSKVTAVPITWTGTAGDGNWATAANWGGTAITDESQSLIFSSATGSSQTNNLPAGTRVQGITFNAGAGADVITPSSTNTLELEGDFINNSTATQTYNGNIDQQTAQINFNAAAGNIVIGGTVNVTNSGGLIISGSSNVTLGGIIQTGMLFGNGGGYADTQIIKSGTGTLILNGPGTFAGQTFINAGTVQLGNPLALENSTVDLAVNNSLNLNGLNATLGWLAGGGSLSIGASSSLTLGNSNPATNYATPNYFGTLSGSGSLMKSGNSLQMLSGNNTFAGSVSVSGGTLFLEGSNAYSGGTNLNGGTLATPLDASLGMMGVTFNGGTLQALSSFSSSRAMLLSGSGTMDTNGQTLTLLGNFSGGGLLTKIGSGILVLRGSDFATGGILVQAGEINAASTAGLGSAGLDLSGGALQLGASFDPSVAGITIGSGGGAIDTNGFNATFSTALSGTGGLIKIGAGTLSFATAPTYSGATTISAGTLQATGTSGGVLGPNAIVINGGLISVLPNLVSSSSNINVTLGGSANPAITTSGTAGIVLGQNGNNSLTVSLGESGGIGIAQTGGGTITVANASGIANLGSSSGERLLVAGTAPAVTDGIVAPWLVGLASTSSAAADFLTYSTSNGFQRTTSYTTRTGTFTPAMNEISNITATATANSGNPYAVRLGAYTLTVAAGATLTVGNGTSSGVILNGGTITGGTLAFNTATGYVYTGGVATINSTLSGTGGLTVFGSGSLTLGSSSNTLSGNIVVNGATLNASNDAALGAAANSITLNGGILAPANGYTQSQAVMVGFAGGGISIANQLTLAGALTGNGTLTKNGNGTLVLSGGSADTLTGPISVNAGILQTASGASLASTTGSITVASSASFDAFGDYDGTTISNPIWLSGNGTGGYGALNGGGNITLAGAITLNADSTISHDYNYFTLNSTITASNHNLKLASTQLGQPFMAVNDPITLGSGSLTITGPNGVSLNAVDSYSGGTDVSSGTLQLGNTGALGSSALNVSGGTVDLNGLSVTVNGLSGAAGGTVASSSSTSNSTLTVNQTTSSTYAGTLADTISPGDMQLSLELTGSGSLTLYGTNTFSGTTRIYSGALILASSLALQNSTLDLDSADTGTISFGSLTAVTLGGLEGSRNLSNALPLTIGSNGQTTVYSGSLSGTGSLIKIGNGMLEFSGTNNYSGGTLINGGALQFDSIAAIPANPTLLTLNAGGAVAATGAYNGVTGWLNSGRIGSSTAGALALTSNSSETINLTTAGGGAFSNLTLGAVGSVTYTGVYTPLGNTYRFGGGGGTLKYSPAISGSKAVDMANPGMVVFTANNNYSGGTTITAGTLQMGSSSAIGSGAVSVSGGGTLDLNGYNIGSIPLSLGGAGVNGLGALQNSSATTNAASSGTITLTANATIGVDNSAYAGRMDIGGGVTCINGGTYTLTKAGPGVLRINAGIFTVGAINVSAGSLEVLANNNVLIANRPVSVSSGAALFLYNDNDAANTTLVAGGTLEDNSGNNAVSGTTTLSGSGNANFTIDSAITLTVTGPITGSSALNIAGNSGLAVVLTNSSNNWTGGTTLNTGTLQVGAGGTSGVLPGNISDNTALVFDRADTLTYAGGISGTGSVSQAGGGIVILAATNTYTGNTNVSSGVIRASDGVGLPAASALVLDGGTFETGGNFVRPLGTTAGTVSLGAGADGFSAYAGPVTVSIGGLATPASLIWGSTTNFSPTSLLLNANSASGTLTLQNPIDFNGAARTINVAAGTAVAAGILSNSNASSAGLIKTGAGTLILTAANTYNGNTNISAGTLQVGNVGSVGVIPGNVIDNAALSFNRTDSSITFGGGISGSGTVAQSGAGILILSGNNSYAGITRINSGEIQLASSTALGNNTAGVVIASGATLDENGFPQGAEPITMAGAGLNGLGALINSNSSSNASVGPITLTGNATIGVESPAYAGRMDIGGTATCVNGSTYSLTKAGAGNLRINGGTCIVGALNISAGTVSALANNNVLSAGLPVSVSGGGTLFLYYSNDAANTTLAPNATLEDNSGLNLLSGTTTLTGSGSANFSFDNNPGLTLTASGPITGTGGINMNVGPAGGKLLLTNTSNNYSGGTVINSGILTAGAANSLSPASAYQVYGTLDASAFNNSIASLVVGSGGTLNLGIGNILAVTGAATFAGTLNLSTGVAGALPEILLTYSSHSGTFGTALGVPTGDKLLYTANALELKGNGPSSLTWDNAGGSGDGTTWNTSQPNWNNGSEAVAYSDISNSAAGDNVAFTDDNNGNYNVTLPVTVHPTSVTVNTTKAYLFSGTGGIGGTTALTKQGFGFLTLGTSNSYTGGTNVSSGTLVLTTAGAFPADSDLTIANGAQVSFANHGGAVPLVPVLSSLSNAGSIDLNNNAMILHNGSIGTISAQIGAAFNGGLWNGSGSGVITSSAAAADTTHLTAVGVATGLSSFEGQAVLSTDVLVKYTYYGDADLSGIVDGSDYSRIDNGYLTYATGWYNGDFNFDGVIDGSDYTLIDNAFNSQGVQITAEFAAPVDQLAPAGGSESVPEPAMLGLLATGATGLLVRRLRKRC